MEQQKRMIITLTYEAEYNDEVSLENIHEKVEFDLKTEKQKTLNCYDYDYDDREFIYRLKLTQIQTSIENRTMITTGFDKED